MTSLDDIQQAAETCPDCGRPFGTEAEFDSAERVVCGMGPEMRSSTYHYDGFAIGLCRVGTIERLRSRIVELEAALGRAEDEKHALLCAGRGVLFANENIIPGVSRERAEAMALETLRVVTGRFPHPCGQSEKLGLIAGGKTNG